MHTHRNAKVGSGGVVVFIRKSLLQWYKVTVMDKTYEDSLWINGICGTILDKRLDGVKYMISHIWFPDLHHIHENSVETLGPKYSIVIQHKNTIIWSFTSEYHYVAQR